jgi:hypothetical protein
MTYRITFDTVEELIEVVYYLRAYNDMIPKERD